MKTRARLIVVVLALAFCTGRAGGQPLSTNGDPQAVILEELVVRARAPGPAWWRVSRGDSVVWVLGVPSGLPKGTPWNESPLRARLAASQLLLLPPQVRVGPLQAIAFFIGHRKALRSNSPLEQALPPALAGRFAKAREGLGKPANRYANWKPAIAGVIMDVDFRRTVKLEAEQPIDHIRALARQTGVRERRAADYSGGPVLNVITAMSDEAQQACLQDALAEVESGVDRMQSAAKGWANGDTRAALAMERGYDQCFAALPGVSALITRGQNDMAGAIAAALSRPGQTIAVVDLRALLARGGVIEQLKAQGLAVATPDGAT